MLVFTAAGARVTDKCLPDGTVPALYKQALLDSAIPYTASVNAAAYGARNSTLVLVNVNTNDWNCGGFNQASAAAYDGMLTVRILCVCLSP